MVPAGRGPPLTNASASVTIHGSSPILESLMGWDAWFTLLVVLALLAALVREWLPTDIIMLAALVSLVAVGELSGSTRLPGIGQAVSGMGNSGLVTVGILFVVVVGLG